MKRIASIVLTAMLLVILSVSSVFAASGLELVESSPAAGYEKVQPQNVMVKLFFNDEVSGEAAQAANKNAFSIKDGEGKKVDFTVYYNENDATNVNLMIENDLVEGSEYTVTVAGTMVDNEGDTLGKDEVIDFKTSVPNSKGYML
ncbi:MAG: Ig-like domain-containing protein, partial [Firmicutes bacterium]|nr:Ig-like domain-containing protein [Bacillota bacterium]